ncbi:hypothetical protein LINPERHAP2_LOCUS32675 [Linum perenne]
MWWCQCSSTCPLAMCAIKTGFMERHEKICSKDRVKGWRKALNHVANTRGFCVTEQESEAILVKDISTQLVRMLDDIAERPETETSSSTIKVVVDNLETSDDI